MNTEWRQVQDFFFEALELETPARNDYLHAKAESHPEIYPQLISLLESHEKADNFMETPPTITRSAVPTIFLDLQPGQEIADFKIERVLGAGSFATVYLARQISLGRLVAIKVSPDYGEEARHMAPLEHEHIVRVFSQTQQGGLRMLCMQYVPGITLENLFEHIPQAGTIGLTGTALLDALKTLSPDYRRPFESNEVKDVERLEGFDGIDTTLWFGCLLADALAHAHQKGVLHLDVKPGNILINHFGRPLLTDFNVSFQRHNEGGEVDITGGTMNYMAPEQKSYFSLTPTDALPKVDERADIYSLGVILKQMFDKVFFGERQTKNLDLKISVDYFRAIIDKCLADKPEDRFESAASLGLALRNCLEHRTSMRLMPKPGGMRRWEMRHPITAIILLTVAPQLIGSTINISYNYLRIVSHLTADQQSFFQFLCAIYNPVAYGLIMYLTLQTVGAIFSYLRKPKYVLAFETQTFAKFRRSCVTAPTQLAFLISAGWIVGMFFFPTMIHLFRGPVEKDVFVHFAISFLLSWIVALTYSVLFNQSFMLRVLYPRFCIGLQSIRKTTKAELEMIGGRIERFHLLAGFVPLLSAVLLLSAGPGLMQDMQYRAFQFLVAFLIVVGLIGFVTALQGTREVGRTLHALTGQD